VNHGSSLVRRQARTASPSNGKCQLCHSYVGRHNLVWHHCHDCGAELGWLCNPCNMPLTEHILHRWDKVDKFVRRHVCSPRLLDVPPVLPDQPTSSMTRPLHLSNGGGDNRYVNVSKLSGHVTCEQLGVILGINANSARDLVSGRKGSRRAVLQSGTWFVPIPEVIELLKTRNRT
jgi:Recombination endonuclease VII